MPSSSNVLKVKGPIRKVVVVPADEVFRETAPGSPESQEKESPPPEEMIHISQKEFQQELQFAYQKGMEEGKIEGFRHAEEEMAQTMATLQKLIQEIQTHQKDFFHQVEQYLLQLVFAMVEKIVVTVAPQQKEVIRHTVQRILEKAQLSGRIKFRVHPEDLKILQELEPEIRRNFPDVKELGFVGDAAITPGGCVVETDLGKLDGQIEAQLQEMVQQLKRIYQQL